MKYHFLAIIVAMIVWTGAKNHLLGATLGSVDDDTQEMLFLLVGKKQLRADLMSWPKEASNARVLMSFRIAVGKVEGDKQVEGDNKTPEGIYFAQRILPGRSLPEKYGPLAIPIDFPNDFDRNAGITGSGIWLHGVAQDKRVEAAMVTEGCVAFYNSDIDLLSDWLEPRQAVVMITEDSDLANPEDEVAALVNATRSWQKGWDTRDMELYGNAYHKEFKSSKGGRRAYLAYKKRVFRGYRRMSVDFEHTRVFVHPKYAMSVMNQRFNGDGRYRSHGRKVLFWEKDEAGQWRIVIEEFSRLPLKLTRYSAVEIAEAYKKSHSARLYSSKLSQGFSSHQSL